jgi:hypothetical protein
MGGGGGTRGLSEPEEDTIVHPVLYAPTRPRTRLRYSLRLIVGGGGGGEALLSDVAAAPGVGGGGTFGFVGAIGLGGAGTV